MDEQPDYRKNVYLLTAIAYKKLDKLDSATAIVSYFTDSAQQRPQSLSRGLRLSGVPSQATHAHE